MPAPINEQVVEYFGNLFQSLFTDAFQPRLTELLRRKAVSRRVEETADAASQSLARFLVG